MTLTICPNEDCGAVAEVIGTRWLDGDPRGTLMAKLRCLHGHVFDVRDWGGEET